MIAENKKVGDDERIPNDNGSWLFCCCCCCCWLEVNDLDDWINCLERIGSEEVAAPEAPKGPTELEVLLEIRDALAKQA